MPMGRNDPIGCGYPVPQNLRVDHDSEDPDELFGVTEDIYDVVVSRSAPLNRGTDYPYDEPGEVPGAPNTNSHSINHSFGITPVDTNHSAWDDIEEILGYPALLSRADSGQSSNSPAGIEGWANNPPKPWDEDTNENFEPKVPPVEIPTGKDVNFHGGTDDDIERNLQRIWGMGDNPNATPQIVKPQQPMDIRSAWDPLNIADKDSAWGELVKIMMMKDLMNQQRKEPTSVVISTGDPGNEDDN